MPPLGIGILGASSIATRRALPALTHMRDYRVVRVGSHDVAHAQAVASPYDAIGCTYNDVLNDHDIQVVYVANAPEKHHVTVVAALHAGKHVIVEKPGAARMGEALREVTLAEQQGVRLYEAYSYAHHPQFDLATSESRMLHGPTSIRASFASPAPSADDHRWASDPMGGVLSDKAGYPIHTARHVFRAEPMRALGVAQRDGTLVGVQAIMEFPDHRTLMFEVGWNLAYHSHFTLVGRDGFVHVPRAYGIPATHRAFVHLSDRRPPDDRDHAIAVGVHDNFAHMFRHVARVLRGELVIDWEGDYLAQTRAVNLLREALR